jgi:DNA mismatch repair ATPase MutS
LNVEFIPSPLSGRQGTIRSERIARVPPITVVFDYRLRPGISTTKNAIKLLEKLGFPPDIIGEARRLVDAGR